MPASAADDTVFVQDVDFGGAQPEPIAERFLRAKQRRRFERSNRAVNVDPNFLT